MGPPATETDDETTPGGTESPPSVFVLGAGVVGTALACWLLRAEVQVVGLHGRQSAELSRELWRQTGSVKPLPRTQGPLPEACSEADVVLMAVRDERVPEMVERLLSENRLRAHQVLLHVSGAHPAKELLTRARDRVRALGTFHPLLSFAAAAPALARTAGLTFGLEGDADARRVARLLAAKLGAKTVELPSEKMALYHAGAVFVSNYLVALADRGRALLVAAGVPEDQALPALIPLMESVVQNLAQLGAPAALTGPVERGDAATVERHLDALSADAPAALDLYRALGREVVRLAAEKGAAGANNAAWEALLGVKPEGRS